ncbi:MAG: hypothetical protein H7A43_02575 [Verrucomicrobia bacterium]|nr:hypothetical protein [Verrucomicrobiota bacterium]
MRAELIEEYSLHEIEDEIKIGVYHLGLLVLSIPTDAPETFPYYYRGIQLKPYRRQNNGLNPTDDPRGRGPSSG